MFSEIIGNCVLPENLVEAGIAGFFYELPKGWEIISLDTVFKQKKVGKGFWATVVTACAFQEATETASLLKSNFFKADETAESIINGGNYELKTANYITSNGLNTLTFEYKILNALMQLGYNRLAFTLWGQPITANLNEFQKKNGLLITDFVDKETMLALDHELSEREKFDREIADQYPPFAHFIEAPLNEPPKAHLAALYAGFYAAIPRFDHIRLRGWTTDEFRFALLNHGASPGRMLNPEGTRVLTFDEMAEAAVKKLDFKFCGSGAYYHKFRDYSKNPDDDTACLKPIDTIRSFNSASSDLHYMELFAHEFGHLVGGQQITLDNGRTDRADFLFGEISFYKSNGKWFWVRQSGPMSEFVSEYARVSVSNELDPKSYDSSYYIPAEDFAESFFAYIFVGNIFRERAKSDVYLRQKYDFLKKYIFQAVEYDTGDVKSLQLWESKNSGIPFHPDYYLLFDPDFTWNYKYDKLK